MSNGNSITVSDRRTRNSLQATPNQLQRLHVPLTPEIPIQHLSERRPLGRNVREQRHARFQVQVVRRPEYFVRGSIGDRQQGLDALAQPGTQDGMIEVCLGLGRAFYRVVPRGGTESEAVVLREDVPHPM